MHTKNCERARGWFSVHGHHNGPENQPHLPSYVLTLGVFWIGRRGSHAPSFLVAAAILASCAWISSSLGFLALEALAAAACATRASCS